MEEKRVLIAEDEPAVLYVEKRILEKAGYAVDGVTTGEEAFALV